MELIFKSIVSGLCGVFSGFFAYIIFLNLRRYNRNNLKNLIISGIGIILTAINLFFTSNTTTYPTYIYLILLLLTAGVSHYMCARIGSRVLVDADIRSRRFFSIFFLGVVLDVLEPSHQNDIKRFLSKLGPKIISIVFNSDEFSYAFTLLKDNKLYYIIQERDINNPFIVNQSIAGVSLLMDDVYVMPDDGEKTISHSLINDCQPTKIKDIEADRSGQNTRYKKYLCVPIINTAPAEKVRLGVLHIDTNNENAIIGAEQRKEIKKWCRVIAPIFNLLKSIPEE